MCFAVMGEDVFYFIVHFHSVFTACFCYHVDASERFDGSFQQFISLQTDNKFIVLINIPGFMRSDGRYGGIVQSTDAIVVPFFFESLQTDVPDTFGTFGRSLQEDASPV